MSIRQYGEAVSSGFWANSAPILPLPVEWGQRASSVEDKESAPSNQGARAFASAPSRTVARAVGRFRSAHSSVTQGKTEHTPV